MASRVRIIAKLGLLLGAPLALLTSLFATGIYCGVHNGRSVLTFERDVLGMDVVVPPEDTADVAGKGAGAAAEGAEVAEKGQGETPIEPARPAKAEDRRPADPDPAPTVPAPDTTPVVHPVPTVDSFPVAIPEPLDDEAASRRLATLRTLNVKVLVDPELITKRPDWIDYASRLVDAASRSYQNLFGIELRLVGVVRWEVATAALGRAQMLEDLAGRPTEGADLLVALTARSIEDDRGPPSIAVGDHNGESAIVFADSRGRAPHLRPLLRELGHAFGAADVTDPQSDGYQRGSWMSSAPVPEGASPWIDRESRRVILERKDHPFREAK